MLVFCLAILFVFILIIIKHGVGIHKSMSFIKTSSANFVNHRINRLALIVPVFEEQSIIDDTIEYFESIRVDTGVGVYYVTTGRESEPGSTKSIISSKIGDNSIIHYPKTHGYKASQLNFALSKLKHEYDFIGIFDADSKPDINGIKYVESASKEIDILQMPSIYNTNYENLGVISKANAIFQTRWTLCYEIPQWIKWSKARKENKLMYLVGHGLFLNTKLITKCTFDEKTITEDLFFGYKSSLSNKKLRLVPFFDYCSCPKSLF